MTIEELQKQYDSLQERFQFLWFENHRIKEKNIELEDKIKNLKEKLLLQDGQKLKNFPSINVISITESENRRNFFKKEFSKYGIYDYHFHIYERFKEEDHKIIGTYVNDHLSFHSKGPVTSHLKAIKSWLETTNEDYTFFCEDDLSTETVHYWNFNWSQFFERIPNDWGIVQLVILRNEEHGFLLFGDQFRTRCWCDWSCAGYLIKRSFAKKLIENYYPNNIFTLEYCGIDYDLRHWTFRIPTVETVIYTLFDNTEKVYAFPLFCENLTNCPTTVKNLTDPDSLNAPINKYSYRECIKLWKRFSRNFHLDYIFEHIEKK